MRVAFEATALLGSRSGVGEFVHGALSGLSEIGDLQVDAFAISWRRRGLMVEELPSGIGFIDKAMPARPLQMAWRHMDFPPVEVFFRHYDIVHGSNFVVPPSLKMTRIVTVHDLTPLKFPQLCHPSVLIYPDLIRRAIRSGAVVHTPSEYVRGEVVEAFSIDPARVVAVAHGIPTSIAPSTDDAGVKPTRSEEWLRGARFILALGTIEPRKGYEYLLGAFELLADEDSEVLLVIGGAFGWGSDDFTSKLESLRHRDRVRIMGRVSDRERDWLLSNASLFVYPSIYEGFGLPPLEAMRAGVPVVTTTAGAIPEVVGQGAYLVEAKDTYSLAQGCRDVLGDVELQSSLKNAGFARAAEFSWSSAARGLEALYRGALLQRGRG